MDDQRHGLGSLVWTDGTRFEGSFKGDKRLGKGSLWSADGHLMYEGEWAADVFHGSGTHHAENGDVYQGYFQDGLRSGSGVLTAGGGEVYTGEWVEVSWLVEM